MKILISIGFCLFFILLLILFCFVLVVVDFVCGGEVFLNKVVLVGFNKDGLLFVFLIVICIMLFIEMFLFFLGELFLLFRKEILKKKRINRIINILINLNK